MSLLGFLTSLIGSLLNYWRVSVGLEVITFVVSTLLGFCLSVMINDQLQHQRGTFIVSQNLVICLVLTAASFNCIKWVQCVYFSKESLFLRGIVACGLFVAEV